MGRQSQAFFAVAFLASLAIHGVFGQQCLSDSTLNADFETDNPTCCQNDVCALPCPEPVAAPPKGYGIAVGVSIAISFLLGIATLYLVKDKVENFFIAGRSLPLWILAFTLGAQSIDSNSILGNADLSFKFSFYDGAVLPIGIGTSLLINGLFLAHHINAERNVLTLPDVYARRYGKIVEVLLSCSTIISFIMLLAGNLVGMGSVLAIVYGISKNTGVWIAATIIWAYTVSGGLFSVAYTDVVQAIMGWSGCLVFAYYTIANADPRAPPPSIGFPGYIYPDGLGEGGICDMYEGVSCTYDATLCCYNEAKWCPSSDSCTTDNGAYPIGDKEVYSNQMVFFNALAPFPNSILWNWATIFVLAFGNLAALDFQARCLAAKTPSAASYGCIIAGLFTFFIGVPFSYMGAIVRTAYGPDSIHAVFDTDSCSPLLGSPTCATWVPDPNAFLYYLSNQTSPFLGAWCMVGIVCASMSTADGAILAMGTVFAHNLMRQFDAIKPDLITPKTLLTAARVSTVPLTLASALIATSYQNDNPQGATGYLLIIAFDVVLSTSVVPLFGCFYAKVPRPNAALLSIICGACARITMQFTLPKDGYLLLPYDVPEFQKNGPAASAKFPVFVDAPADEVWNPDVEVCETTQFKDFTGVDSLASLLISFLVFCTVQALEHHMDRPLFTLRFMEPYEKDLGDTDDVDKSNKTTELGEADMSAHKAASVNGDEKAKSDVEVSSEQSDSEVAKTAG